MDRYYRRYLYALALFALVLAGCASTGPAPVDDLNGGSSRAPQSERRSVAAPRSDRYRVRRGDTLYSIAFRNGLDYRDVAAWNGIAPPYTIYPGDQLRLSPRAVVASRPPPRTVAPAPRAAAPPPVAAATTKPAPAAPASPAPKPAPPPPPPQPAPPSPPVATNGDVAWHWPADGAVVGGYVAGDPLKQGIDIAGQAGAPVRAAADGLVVYSGNGLIGYGELIIVKHSPAFLSAYGHNRKRLVQEGDRVKAGQTIAEMGASGATRNELHFEIRKNGKPIDPTAFLPRR